MAEDTASLIYQSIPTETVDTVRRIVPLEPNAPPPQPSDSSRNPPDEQRPPRAKYDPPYIMGSTTTGSGAFTETPFEWADPGNTLGPWGGDAPPADEATVRTDTWHRDRPPLDASSDRTWGVKCDLTRIYEEPQGTTPETYIRYAFERQAVFDAQGTPVYITGETLVESSDTAGETDLSVIRQPFEVYLSGLMDGSSPKVFVAWGTVCETNPANNTAFPIASESLDKLWTLAVDQYIWLEADFYESGSLITLKMKCGVPADNGWTNFPMSYASGSTTGGNYWRHPIAHYRAGRTSKSTVNALAGNPYPDSGEEPEAHASYTIAQLTNTHLVALQVCEYADSVERRLIWKLTPGPGAVTGTGS